jgi:hypothetical protein
VHLQKFARQTLGNLKDSVNCSCRGAASARRYAEVLAAAAEFF